MKGSEQVVTFGCVLFLFLLFWCEFGFILFCFLLP